MLQAICIMQDVPRFVRLREELSSHFFVQPTRPFARKNEVKNANHLGNKHCDKFYSDDLQTVIDILSHISIAIFIEHRNPAYC